MDVPHDFIVEGRFNGTKVDPKLDSATGYLPLGVGWYRRTWRVPSAAAGAAAAAGRAPLATLTFDGVFRNCTVWLNGRQIGRHASGYTSFHLPVSDVLHLDGRDNVLVVRADATRKEGWWVEGGGIYRHVRLTLRDDRAAYIAPWGTRVVSHITGVIGPGETGDVTVEVQASLGNEGSAAWHSGALTVRATVFAAASPGVALGTATVAVASLPPGAAPGNGSAAALVAVNVSVGRVALWSVDRPTLYTVKTELLCAAPGAGGGGGRGAAAPVPVAVDADTTRFGPRRITIDPAAGLFLNGRHLKLKGVANHLDFAGTGNALPDRIQWFKVRSMKRMGVNAWRCVPLNTSGTIFRVGIFPEFASSCTRAHRMGGVHRTCGCADEIDVAAGPAT